MKKTMMRLLFKLSLTLVFVFHFSVNNASADFNPLPGGNLLHDLLSPALSSSGSPLTQLDFPSAAMNNPAAPGFLQRTTAELNYTALNGRNNDKGWGNVVFTGLSIPGRAGVLTASLFFMNSDFSSLDTGIIAGTGVSFSKDIFDNLSAGAGITAAAGSNSNTDWMLAADFGIIHYPEDFLSDKNFRWAAVFKTMGKGYTPLDEYSSSPSVFTPGIGAGLTLFENEKFSADFTSDLLLPSVRNLRADAGASFGIGNFMQINISGRADVRNLLDNDAVFTSFVPSIGVSFGFKTNLERLNIEALKERDWNRTELITDTSVTGIGNNLTAFGLGVRMPFGVKDNEGPEIKIDYPQTDYISPNNDGIKDILEIPFSITDKRYVMGYEFKIFDTSGNEVRKYLNKEDRPENITFSNIFDRIKHVKTGIAVPDSLVWDGTDNERKTVPDGIYRFQVTAWDDNSNISLSEKKEVIVDNTPPRVEIGEIPEDDRIFSPDGDGSKDFLTIRQSGSTEYFWLGEILDSSEKRVETFNWDGDSPADIFWDGTDDSGAVLPNGVYAYKITGRDYAGNETEAVLENIIISNIQTPLGLMIDLPAFSPNNNGIRDYLVFTIDVPVKTFIQSWTLDILSPDNRISASFEGLEDIPETLRFDGKSADGKVLPEGRYQGRLQVVYRNGNMPEVKSSFFEIDVTPPAASASAEYTVFSPDGDGNKDVLIINQQASAEDEWNGVIKDLSGTVIKEITWKGTAPSRVIWDGVAGSGRLAPDGEYTYELFTEDAAGNRGSSGKISFIIDTEETPVIISRNYDAFSPNNSGAKDVITFYTQVKREDGIVRYHFGIIDINGSSVYERRGEGSVPETIVWDGRGSSGVVRDGRYRAFIDVLYINGNNPVSETQSFIIDTVYPSIDIEAEYLVFSPNNDNRKDTLEIKMFNTSHEDRWTAEIRDSAGNVVKTVYMSGAPDRYVWDGRDNTGNILPDGKYFFTVYSRDNAGNYTEKSINNIVIDNRPVQIIASVDRDGFSPNRDGNFDTIRFSTLAIPNDSIEKWELSIINNSTGTAVKSFTGTQTMPGSIIWDGKTDTGSAPDSIYRAELAAVYIKGDTRTSVTRPFILDTTPPVPEIFLSPIPFSPDNDGVDDELSIMISLKDMSSIRDWSFDIRDPYNKNFRKFSGRGRPAERLVWDGYSDGGELVQAAEDYPFIFTASDIYGNTAEMRGIIPVDVLVIRDGDNLKINISSMNFAPNSPELVTDIPEIKEKNERIIERLAEILNKYSTYKIKIEGHANNLSWFDPVKAAVEEKEELQPLSSARCVTVRDLLVQRGVAESRMSMIGMGGTRPIVPFSDLENRWKNRRVEFILIK